LIEVQSSKNQDVIIAISTLHAGSGEANRDTSVNNSTSKLKICGVAIAIIVGIIGLTVCGAGLVGYFHVGSLSNLNQVHAITMMAAGSVGGAMFLIIGIVGLVKNCSQKSNHQRNDESDVDNLALSKLQNSDPRSSEKIEKPNITLSSARDKAGLVYGPDAKAWKNWGVEILDKIPEAPQIQWHERDPYFDASFEDNYLLVYIPKRIRFNGKEQDLTLKTFKAIGSPFDFFSEFVEDFKDPRGNDTAGGWVLLSKRVIPNSRNKNYAEQQQMVKANKDFYVPYALEAIVLNLVVHASTGEQLYGRNPITYTRCADQISDNCPVIVGSFGFEGLSVFFSSFNYDDYGVACAFRKF
jgi:hypothetical protein